MEIDKIIINGCTSHIKYINKNSCSHNFELFKSIKTFF